jgi:hypothetical protein
LTANHFIDFGMKRDGRKLDHKTLEEIRLMAIERVASASRSRRLPPSIRGMSADLFVAMLQLIMRGRRRLLFLILESLPAHKAKVLCQRNARQTRVVLPARLCAGTKPGRTRLELHEAHRPPSDLLPQRG